MPHSTAELPRRRANRLRARGAHKPRPHHSDRHDPVTTRKHKPLLTAGNVALFTGMVAFGLYATGHLQQFDHFFDHLHAFGRAHNDAVVHGIMYGVPVMLVVLAIAGLVAVRVFAAEAHREAAAAPAVRAVRRSAAAVKSARASATRLISRSFRARSSRAARDFPPRDVCRTARDSVAALPVQPPPRPESLRRDPHSPLPPAVAAALKEHLAAVSARPQ